MPVMCTLPNWLNYYCYSGFMKEGVSKYDLFLVVLTAGMFFDSEQATVQTFCAPFLGRLTKIYWQLLFCYCHVRVWTPLIIRLFYSLRPAGRLHKPCSYLSHDFKNLQQHCVFFVSQSDAMCSHKLMKFSLWSSPSLMLPWLSCDTIYIHVILCQIILRFTFSLLFRSSFKELFHSYRTF